MTVYKFVGITTKITLRKRLEEGDISPAEVSTFYKSALAFYVQAMEYALANLPLRDDFLKNARFATFSSRNIQSSGVLC